MRFTFVPAEEATKKSNTIIGLSGLSWSGKTYSALLIAQALAAASGRPVYGIDSERGRMADYANSKYPDLNPFKIALIEEPYSSERYLEAIKDAESVGAGCIVVDSFSDEWDGPGGVLDLQEEVLTKFAGTDNEKRNRMNFAAWAKVKPAHNRLLNELTRLDCHLILCFRAQDKNSMQGGKIIHLGLKPICGKGIPYLLKFHLLMDEDRRDGSYKVLKGGYQHEVHVFPEGKKIDSASTRRLIEVLGGDSTDETKPKEETEPVEQKKTEEDSPKKKFSDVWEKDLYKEYKFIGGFDPPTISDLRLIHSQIKREIKAAIKEGKPASALVVAESNKALIGSFPTKGREELEEIISTIPPLDS